MLLDEEKEKQVVKVEREFYINQDVIVRDYRKPNKNQWAKGQVIKRCGKYV